jgi:probable phosphoglycerate mutase
MMAKKIISIQHTQSKHHGSGMVGSWTDWELTEFGREQAENIGRRLAEELKGQEWKIYSSDLARARQTVEPFARYMGLEINFMRELREINNVGEIAIGKSLKWYEENAAPPLHTTTAPSPARSRGASFGTGSTAAATG